MSGNNVMIKLAHRLYDRAMESADEMGQLSKQQEEYAAQRKMLRELKQSLDEKVRSSSQSGTGQLTADEIQSIIDAAKSMGVDPSAAVELQKTIAKNGGYIWMDSNDPDATWDDRRRDLVRQLKGAIDERKEEIGDQDDQLSFKLQVMFNKYSTAMGQASSTVQNLRQNNQTINQKLA